MPKPVLDLIVASAIVQTATVPAALFNPPLDRTFTYVTEQVRSDPEGERRYRVERALRFSRDADGLFADLTLIRIDGDADGGGFERGLAGLKDRTIRYRLDPQGRLTTIPGLDGHWAAFAGGMANTDAPQGAQRALAMLRSAPPAQQRAMLWSMIEPVILPGLAAQTPYRLRPVSQPGRAPFAAGAMLSGTESLSHVAGGSIELRRMVSGTHRATLGQATEPVERERDTRVMLDAATGLLTGSTEVTRTRIGAVEQVVTTRLSLVQNQTGN
jgi:hypothetical protein